MTTAREGGEPSRSVDALTGLVSEVIEHVPLPSYLFRVEGADFVLEAVNRECLRLNPGIPSLIGFPMKGIYRHQPEAIAAAERCVREGVKVVREMSVRRYDRTEATQDVRLTFLPLPPQHMLLFMENIATPNVAELALGESEARYRSLVLSLPDAVLLRGSDGRVLACNEVAVRLLGAESVGALIGRQDVLAPGRKLFDERGVPLAETDFPSRRVLVTGKPELGRLYQLHDQNEIRWVRVSAQPIVSSTGAVTGSVTLYADVTERQLLEEELRRAHRLESLGRLAGGVAHDFNNLLAAILGSSDLLATHVTAAGSEDLATIRLAAQRARDLTRQLLAFARKQPAEFRDVELTGLIRAVDLLLRRVVRPNVDLDLSSDGAVWVRADPTLLEQVLVNLVVNASDAMPDGGRVEVSVTRLPDGPLGDTAVLQVSDSGVGIDEKTLSLIFDPFFTTKEHGMGLGLASSYGIIRQHGGDISAESRPGQGTRFRVLLPARKG